MIYTLLCAPFCYPNAVPNCAEYEVYKTCGPAQDGTCADPIPIMQPGTCTPGCSCIEGFVSHAGNCINVTECPSMSH